MGLLGNTRAQVGSRVIEVGENVQEVASDFASAWDKRPDSNSERTVEVAGKVVSQLGYAILPELLHAENESDK